MIQLFDRHKKMIDEILKDYLSQSCFFVFGSRSRGNAKPFSDIDLAFDGDLSSHEQAKLMTALEESNLPFKVDLINLKKISEDFKNRITNDLVLWQ